MSHDGTCFRSFDAEIGERIFAYVSTTSMCTVDSEAWEINSPNKLLAYMLAERKSHSPDMAPSGVKHDMLVDFMTCLR